MFAIAPLKLHVSPIIT